ncbi:hypothetical protein KUTeg_013577 [Tegillarca granosa]|uniref:receptor protein-tyrosine kinase n=1 Tax=Tegillarca granosa TaxID=220873 RepID=A0ABQ9EU40_TEGGR|nr:hypothetical protein KUTeg_013577 [Tegillarca granosa]
MFIISVRCQDTFYFSRKPESKDVVINRETVLYCDVSNRKHIVFSWFQSGKPITNTSRRFQEGSNLHILRVTRPEDEGPFQCIATNVTSGFSLQSKEAVLNIQWIDQVAEVELKRPKKEEIALGTDLILKCQIDGNPEPSFLWYQNKFRLFNNDRKKLLDKGSRLKISGVTAEDNGIYSCRAENVAGEKDSSVNFLLNVQAPNTPHLIESQFTKSLLRLKNQEARLDCPFVNATRVDWFSNYEKISNSSRHTIFSNGSLYFPRVRLSDEGSYRCEGLTDNRDIPAQTFTSELILSNLGDFRSDSFEPRLIRNYPIVIPLRNRFVVKVFPPSGQPTPTLRWLDKNDLEVGKTGRIHIEGNNLVFSNPQQMDSGNYTCIIENSVGEKRQNVWIIVSVPPRISKAPQPKEVEEGGNVQFSCQVTGTVYPVTTIIWMKGRELIKMGSSRHHMNKMHGILSISNVKSEDVGTYACVANTTGQKLVESSEAYLQVRKKLRFNPIPKNTFIEYKTDERITCKAEGDGHVIVNWLKNGSLNFASHVTNADGTLYFRDVKKTDEGFYTCIAHSDQQGFINATVYIAVVERPRIQTRPHNTTVLEGQTAMLHCVAIGDPRPEIKWDKNSFTDGFDYRRVTIFPNGTLKVSQVYIEDRGKYGCTANNTAGYIRMEAFLDVTSTQDMVKSSRAVDEAGFGMMKTIIIAVCSAGAYLALVIGLTAFCSYRLLMQKRNRKSLAVKSENGDISREQHELLMKDRDSESRTPFRSDSDNRSHVSGMSSHPSHSSQSQTHSQAFSRSRRGSYDSLQFPRHDLQTLGMLGRGVFGDVFLAKARAIRDGEPETLVVVKSLLTRDESLYFEYRQELDMYAKLDHPNISHVLGICRDMEPQFVISEYCDWGDLKQFLLATRSDNGRRIPRVPPLNTTQKLSMCKQVAAGMEHIANHRFVHRDLAARNVLLTSRSELKISSLSLCKDVYKGEYYQQNQNFVPLRWMPPEAAIEDDYSTKSDVWSYGVFVWEVFHLADLPYANMMDEEILKRLKVGDIQLEMSDQCPSEITDLIRKCMTDCPRDRPLFSELSIYLADMASELPVLPPVMLQPNSMAV